MLSYTIIFISSYLGLYLGLPILSQQALQTDYVAQAVRHLILLFFSSHLTNYLWRQSYVSFPQANFGGRPSCSIIIKLTTTITGPGAQVSSQTQPKGRARDRLRHWLRQLIGAQARQGWLQGVCLLLVSRPNRRQTAPIRVLKIAQNSQVGCHIGPGCA